MPYKHTNYKIPPELDKRVKLTPEDKEEIRSLYALGNISKRQLAKQFNVSRRLIQFVLDPKKHEANLLRRAERGGSKQYYDREKNTKAAREHRKRKQELYLKGELIWEQENQNTKA